jgi:hypothetical protein
MKVSALIRPSGTFSHLQGQTGEGYRDYRLLPCPLAWEKVPEGRMRDLPPYTEH